MLIILLSLVALRIVDLWLQWRTDRAFELRLENVLEARLVCHRAFICLTTEAIVHTAVEQLTKKIAAAPALAVVSRELPLERAPDFIPIDRHGR